MNAVFVLRVIACFCFLLGAVPYEPLKPWSWSSIALGLLFFTLSFIVT